MSDPADGAPDRTPTPVPESDGRVRAVSAERVAPIAVADRDGVVETVHHGVAAVVGPEGDVVVAVGDPETEIYPRSSLKPFQAAAMVEAGLELPEPLLALAAASHSGERRHLDGVVEILDRYGLGVEALANTPARPYGAAARAAAREAGVEPSRLQQNCSGKHAAMLATCVVNGWSLDDYLALDHPVQRAIVETVERIGGRVAHVGVDGCGAPTHVMRVVDAARAIGTLARNRSSVTTAMSANPLMVGGTGRDVSVWMEAVPGLVAKEGAAGVMVMAVPDGTAVAFKVADGSDAARQVVTVEALRHLGVDVDGELSDAAERVAVPVLGHGDVVGRLSALPWRP